MNNLLRDAVILDVETTNLSRGAGIHELALYDIQARKLTELIIDPNSVEVKSNTPQDIANISSSARDRFSRRNVNSWYQAITDEIMSKNGIQGNRLAVFESLRWRNPFLYRAIWEGKHPHLSNMQETPAMLATRQERFKRFGATDIELNTRRTIEDILGSDLPNAIKGKTVFIANARFEASQIGAQLAASKIEWRQIFETSSKTSPDPFYVTGVEVNKARVAAQLTGDWRQVWKAYVANPPKPGETAVRDIQDILRSMQSYGRELGLFHGGKAYYGTGVDISSQLFAHAESNTAMKGLSELHRAAEDVAIHENYVLRKGIELTSALEAVQEGTSTGKLYQQMAQEGHGPLAEAARFFSLLEQAAPRLQRAALIQRFGRAYEDLATTGETFQVTGPGSIVTMKQQTMSGQEVKVPRLEHRVERFTNLQDVASYIAKTSDYSDFGVEVMPEFERFQAAATDREAASLFVDQETRALRNIDLGALQPSLKRLSYIDSPSAIGSLIEASRGRIGLRSIAAGAAIMTGLGAAWSLVQERPKEQSSLLGFSYYEWLQNQEGMVNQGIAKENRSKNTDFGSPYQGPVVSSQVLIDQELLQEREKWLREQYGAKHFDPMTGLFGLSSVFKFSNGYRYYSGGTKVENGYQGLKGNNLVSLNLDEGWKITAEDADTITIKRGGIRGAVTSFFGLNQGYSFRLAGIDAPEVAHPGSYAGAQPYAEQAKDVLTRILANGKNKELVFTTDDTSYGRMMGSLVVDGTNLNYELIKRGTVAHLPYGKEQNAIVDYRKMKLLEEQAHDANRGLWQSSWAEAFYETSRLNGQRPTFNTLANTDKIVSSASYMSMVSLMEQSKNEGQFSQNHLAAAQEIAQYFNPKDNVHPGYFSAPTQAGFNHMTELMSDLAQMTKTRGQYTQNKFSTRGNYGKLDNVLALDSLGTTNSVWTRRKYASFDTYDVASRMNSIRKQRMAAQQREINQLMFTSPIGHYRM